LTCGGLGVTCDLETVASAIDATLLRILIDDKPSINMWWIRKHRTLFSPLYLRHKMASHRGHLRSLARYFVFSKIPGLIFRPGIFKRPHVVATRSLASLAKEKVAKPLDKLLLQAVNRRRPSCPGIDNFC